ncbi:MAG: hypothetical protein RLZZ127_1783 [Planctomycetota bacterium]|jgi:RNA polymerase sigma factor (sigma-70 family)
MLRGGIDGVVLDGGIAAAGSGDPEGDLRARALAGDPAALGTLIDRHRAMIEGVCRRILGDAVETEDAVQDVCTAFIERFPGIPAAVPVAAWLHQAAWRCARTRRQRRQTRERWERTSPMPPELGTVDPPGDHAEDLAIVVEELRRLGPEDEALVRLCCMDGVTQREAGVRLGIPPGSVDRRLHRALERLRTGLDRRGVAVPLLVLLAGGAATAGEAGGADPGNIPRPQRKQTHPWWGLPLLAVIATGVAGVCVWAGSAAMPSDATAGAAASADPGGRRSLAPAGRDAILPTDGFGLPLPPRFGLPPTIAVPDDVEVVSDPTGRAPVVLITPPGVHGEPGNQVIDGREVRGWTLVCDPIPDPRFRRLVVMVPHTVMPDTFRMEYLLRAVDGRMRLEELGDAEPVGFQDGEGRRVRWMKRSLEIRHLPDDTTETRVFVRGREAARWVSRGDTKYQGLGISMPNVSAGMLVVADVRVTPFTDP